MWLQLVHEFTLIRSPVLQGLFWYQNLILAKNALRVLWLWVQEDPGSNIELVQILETLLCNTELDLQKKNKQKKNKNKKIQQNKTKQKQNKTKQNQKTTNKKQKTHKKKTKQTKNMVLCK